MKILVVDDSRVMRMLVRRTLRQAGFGGHAVVEADNGKDGLVEPFKGSDVETRLESFLG